MTIRYKAMLSASAVAAFGLSTFASADLVSNFTDNGDGTTTYMVSADNESFYDDGNINGLVDEVASIGGAVITTVGWDNVTIEGGGPVHSVLWLMTGAGGGGPGWYHGDMTDIPSNSYDVAGANWSVNADGTIGAGWAGVGGTGEEGLITGDFYLIFVGTIPAPGALALLGLAGLSSRRRRS